MTMTATTATTLTRILADTYALAVKTHGAHWNVTGPAFFQLHAAFGEQYEALFEAADDLAERVRALGSVAPAGIQTLAGLTTLLPLGPATDGPSLAGALRDDHNRLSAACRAGIAAAESAGDDATADMLTGRIEAHDKTAWMLGACLA